MYTIISNTLVFLILLQNVVFISARKQQQLSPINEKGWIPLQPDTQNIPDDPEYANLRPPKPRISSDGIETSTIFIGLSAFRDGFRCGKTIFTGFKRAVHPERLSFGIIDQVESNDSRCLDEYCKMSNAEWPSEQCRYKDRITSNVHDAINSRGPTLARHFQQQLVGDEEFCMQLDGHSIFTNEWDINIIKAWLEADNEMAVLSTYLHDIHNYVNENGDNKPPDQLPHLCKTIRGTRGLVRNEGASMLANVELPQMTALWGAGLSFNKCHAEKRVPVDSHTPWMFDGEEFLRASHLWTNGYDIYAPSITGAVVYHNYSSVPARFEHVKVDSKKKTEEGERGANRFKLLVGIPFIGEVDTFELDIYGFGKVRSFEQYLKFSGVTFKEGEKDKHTCRQLHWVPYSDPTDVEKLLPGWRMKPYLITDPPRENFRGMPYEPISDTLVKEKTPDFEDGELDGPIKKMQESLVLLIVWFLLMAIVVIGVILYSRDECWIRALRVVRFKPNRAQK